MRRSNQRGFTLLEILVALTLMGLVLTTVIELLSSSLNTAAVAKETAQAALLGRRLMDGLLGQDETFENEDWPQGGALDDVYSWRVTITPYLDLDVEDAEETFPFIIYSCDLSVEWQSGIRTRSVHLKALKTVPKPQTTVTEQQ
ncbi:MAG: type II secretion system protein [Deltaproteobacteria bacterium]|nr:type II secretion system protein [Deltaproteobacteria bacterium]